MEGSRTIVPLVTQAFMNPHHHHHTYTASPVHWNRRLQRRDFSFQVNSPVSVEAQRQEGIAISLPLNRKRWLLLIGGGCLKRDTLVGLCPKLQHAVLSWAFPVRLKTAQSGRAGIEAHRSPRALPDTSFPAAPPNPSTGAQSRPCSLACGTRGGGRVGQEQERRN